MTARTATLPARHVPDDLWFDPVVGAWLATGRCATQAALAQFVPGTMLAVDIETPGLTDAFTMKCVTFAWRRRDGEIQGILLDPGRRQDEAALCKELMRHASTLVMHNSVFDTPGLIWAQLLRLEDIDRIHDTLLFARMADSDETRARSLEGLTPRELAWPDNAKALEHACKANGGRGSDTEWYFRADIHMPTYRFGAMFDTVATLLLHDIMFERAVARLLDCPYDRHCLSTREQAAAEVMKQQRVNQITLRRSTIGFNWNPDYLEQYRGTVDVDVQAAAAILAGENIDPGNGNQLMTALERYNAIPPGYPRTEKTRQWSTEKKHLERLHHPLVTAHVAWKDATKITGYLEDVTARTFFTGRIHPQVNILGAVATGRMSASNPPYQQFPELARPIFTDDGEGWTSVDWSQIEPVTLCVLANDWGFLRDFWLPPHGIGADLYEPVMTAARIDRKTAKTIVLADIYGQGDAATGAKLRTSAEAVGQLKTQMHSAMPVAAQFMGSTITNAQRFGLALTAAGRVLHVPAITRNGFRKVMAYKAVNYGPGQGSAYDILADSIIRCDKAGLSDALRFFMHDEMVVATEAAVDVERIMQTPPDFLLRWTGGVVIPPLRTDRVDLGHHWDAA